MSKFGPEVFSTNSKILYCKMYDVKVGTRKGFNVTQYLSTEKHKKTVSKRKRNLNILELQILKCLFGIYLHIMGIHVHIW